MNGIVSKTKDSNTPNLRLVTSFPAGLSDHVVRIEKALGAMYAAELRSRDTGFDHLMTIKVVGDELSKAKDEFDYGELGPKGKWGSWLKANFSLSMRSADDYIAVAKGWDAIEAKFSSTAAKPTLRWALGIVRQKKPRTKKAAAPAVLTAERVCTIDDVPDNVKADIVKRDADQKQRTADKQEYANRLAWEFADAVRSILATKARPECKIEKIEDALAILTRPMPVMDSRLSVHLVKSDFKNATKPRLHS